MNKLIVFLIALLTVVWTPTSTAAQAVFRSTQSANLPTAAVVGDGIWLFEISHRFDTPISRGADAFWGLDGPVFNRLGLSYGLDRRVMLTVQRSNLQDNLELNVKLGGLLLASGAVPIEAGAQGGIAWNTQVFPTEGATDNEMQAYVQVIGNALLTERFAFGVVPTLLYNARILDEDEETAFVLGLTGQLYLTPMWSVLGEWILSEAREDLANDGASFGIEIATAGHAFKILVTNQSKMNPTQFLAGTANDFTDPDDWRLGFNLTRRLPF